MSFPIVSSSQLPLISEYQIDKSLRFRGTDTTGSYISWSPTGGNRKTWTYSAWVKRGSLGRDQRSLLATSQIAPLDGSNCSWFGFNTSDQLEVYMSVLGSTTTTAVFRDTSAHFHIVLTFDTTQINNSDRYKLYVNGKRITAFTTFANFVQNADYYINQSQIHGIGANMYSPSDKFFDGYLSEVNFVDGIALSPSDFGYFDTLGYWKPKEYTGSYGVTGFYLPFSDSTSTNNLVVNESDTGIVFTATNFSLSGSTYDSMLDVPLSSGIGQRGNYATLNPVFGNSTNINAGMKEGNLWVNTSYFPGRADASIAVTSGKWYWEVTCLGFDNGNIFQIGISSATPQVGSYVDWGYGSDGLLYSYGTDDGVIGDPYTTGDVIGIALDMDAGDVKFYKNGVLQGGGFNGFSGITFIPSVSDNTVGDSTGVQARFNFGQYPFAYSLPSGYKKLHTGNFNTPLVQKPDDNFVVQTRIGNGGNSGSTNYQINKSLRFRGKTQNSYMTAIIPTTVVSTKLTFSAFVRRTSVRPSDFFFCVNPPQWASASDTFLYCGFDGSNIFINEHTANVGDRYKLITTAIPTHGRFFHFMFSLDTTAATASERLKLYIDGVQVTSFSTATYPAQNYQSTAGKAGNKYNVGRGFDVNLGTNFAFEGILADVNLVMGEALGVESFATYANGKYVPKEYPDFYGDNGFQLLFGDNSSLVNLGLDTSGNDIHFTANNISLEVGTNAYDSLIDVPFGSGGNNRSTYPIFSGGSGNITFGGQYVVGTGGGYADKFPIPSFGKWYAEVQVISASTSWTWMCGTSTGINTGLLNQYRQRSAGSASVGAIYVNGVEYATAPILAPGDFVGLVVDVDNNQITYYKNSVLVMTVDAATPLVGQFFYITCDTATESGYINFGQQPFKYPVPSDALRMNTQNTTKQFGTPLAFAPGLLISKSRSSALDWVVIDSARGYDKSMSTNTTGAEVTLPNALMNLDYSNNSIKFGSNTNLNGVNTSFVDYIWKAGTPSNGPSDPHYANVSLLLHMNNLNGSQSIIDSGPLVKNIVAVNNANLTPALSKFGNASAYFDGSGDYFTYTAGSELSFRLDDFTAEMWVCPDSFLAPMGLIGKFTTWNTTVDFFIWIGATNGVVSCGFGNNTSAAINSNAGLTAGVWTHIAVVRSAGVFMMFINGIKQTMTSSVTVDIQNQQPTVFIGSGNVSNFPYKGYIDELRITKGVARYTSDFTLETLPFPETSGRGVTNTDGTIAAQVSANPAAGFSIVTYTGLISTTGSYTVGHGLGIAPSVVITKSRDTIGTDTGVWMVRGDVVGGGNYYATLNTTNGNNLNDSGNGIAIHPNSSVFGVNGSSGQAQINNNYVAYCFAEIPGYSKFGPYTGNGSIDGPFVYCGFRPQWIMIKVLNRNDMGWVIFDTSRNVNNLINNELVINTSSIEVNGTPSNEPIDVYSNGFKLRGTGTSGNAGGHSYTYMAFAEAPFKYSLAR